MLKRSKNLSVLILWAHENLKSVMFRVTRRRLIISYFMLILVWAVVIIVMHLLVGGWSPFWFFVGPSRTLDSDQLKQLMASLVLDKHNVTLANPLLQLLAPGNNFLHFFGLPKRRSHLIYGEVTPENLLFINNYLLAAIVINLLKFYIKIVCQYVE